MDLLLILIILLTMGGLSIPAFDLLFPKYKNLSKFSLFFEIFLHHYCRRENHVLEMPIVY